MAPPPRPPPVRPVLGVPLQHDDVAGHPFRAITSFQNFPGNPDAQVSPSPIRLQAGDVGRITAYNPARNHFRVINLDQPDYMNNGWVDGTDIEISNAKVTTNPPQSVEEGPAPLLSANGITDHRALEDTLWIMTKGSVAEYGEVINYRRTTRERVRYSADDDGTCVFSLHGRDISGGDRHLKFVFSKGAGPPDGATVQPVFEFLTDPTKRHPRCYARLPEVGCFHDWRHANTFAFRCEWKDENGMTKVAYIQRKDELATEAAPKKLGDSGLGSLSSYAWGIALWRYFSRVTPSRFNWWDIKLGLARVREVTMDYFYQEHKLSPELGSSTGTPPSNERRLLDRMATQMAAVGLTGCGEGWLAFPPGNNKSSIDSSAGPRTTCDTCYLAGLECERLEGTDDCTNCRVYYGRPCSWTDPAKLQPDAPDYRKRHDALLPPKLVDLGTE